MTIHHRTKINIKLASLIGASTIISSIAITVPLAVHKTTVKVWNPNDFIYSKYSKEEIANFRKEYDPKTEYLTFNMSRNSNVSNKLLTNNQKFLILAQIKRSSHDLMQFINNNQEKIKAVYKHVYNSDSLNLETSQFSVIDLTKNVQNLPDPLKNFSNQLKDKIVGLQDSVATLYTLQPSVVPSSLFEKIRHVFDINYYYPYGEDLNNLSNKLNWKLGIWEGIDQTGENIDQSSDAMEDTGNEFMDGIAVISKILGCILKLAGFIGEHIINNMLKTINIAQQEWKGVTTHWFCGFIYVGTSVGKVVWWGA